MVYKFLSIFTYTISVLFIINFVWVLFICLPYPLIINIFITATCNHPLLFLCYLRETNWTPHWRRTNRCAAPGECPNECAPPPSARCRRSRKRTPSPPRRQSSRPLAHWSHTSSRTNRRDTRHVDTPFCWHTTCWQAGESVAWHPVHSPIAECWRWPVQVDPLPVPPSTCADGRYRRWCRRPVWWWTWHDSCTPARPTSDPLRVCSSDCDSPRWSCPGQDPRSAAVRWPAAPGWWNALARAGRPAGRPAAGPSRPACSGESPDGGQIAGHRVQHKRWLSEWLWRRRSNGFIRFFQHFQWTTHLGVPFPPCGTHCWPAGTGNPWDSGEDWLASAEDWG